MIVETVGSTDVGGKAGVGRPEAIGRDHIIFGSEYFTTNPSRELPLGIPGVAGKLLPNAVGMINGGNPNVESGTVVAGELYAPPTYILLPNESTAIVLPASPAVPCKTE